MKLKVNGQKLRLETDVIAEGGINYASFQLECDESWNGYVRTVRFQCGDCICDVPDVEDDKSYYLPSKILKEGVVYVGVVGVSQGTHIVTTEKQSFRVEGAVDRGRTPQTDPDAYAKYVKEVSACKRDTEEASRKSFECAEECRRIAESTKAMLDLVKGMKTEVEKALYETSGMLDAVGVVYGNIKRTEERMTDEESTFKLSERHREKTERARGLSDRKRSESEEERREREHERQTAELHRSNAEILRSMSEVQREARIRDIEKRLCATEERKPVPITCITETVHGRGSMVFDVNTAVDSITVLGKTVIENGVLRGVGEGGFLRITVDDSDFDVYLSRPLYSAGDICDELSVDTDGNVNIIRRTDSATVGRDSSFICDGEGERILYASPVTSALPSDDGNGFSTAFTYGATCDGDCVWIDGEYLFMELDGKEFPDVRTLEKRLSESPVTVVYPRAKPITESGGSVIPIPEYPRTVSADAELRIVCRKDIFKIIDNITSRLNGIEERRKNELT